MNADPLHTRARSAIRNLATERDRFVERRAQFHFRGVPYGLTGVPLSLFNENRRWSAGGRLQWADYSIAPFRYQATLRWARSTGDKNRYVARLVIPEIAGSGFGVRASVNTGRAEGRFHGWGNTSVYDQGLVERGSEAYLDSDYYRYFVDRTRALVYLNRRVRQPVWLSLGLGLQRADVGTYSEASHMFLRAQDRMGNSDFGLLGLAVAWDSRDDPSYPTRGVLHSWSYERTHESFAKLASAAEAERFTLIDIRYQPMTPRLAWASRFIFEWIDGAVPMDLYGEIGDGFNRLQGLGGNSSLRGFTLHRFMDDVRFLSNLELSCWLADASWFDQFFEWHLVGFSDTGRVWPALQDMAMSDWRDLHASVGGGLRLAWNRDLVVRFEVGHSSEENSGLIELGRAF